MTDGFDLGALLDSANQMQQQMAAAQEAAAATEIEGQAGGGVVKVTVTGGLEFRAVEIAPEVIDPDDREMLQDLVLAALHDAVTQLNALQAQMMGGFDPSSVDLGGLFGGGETDGPGILDALAIDSTDGADGTDGDTDAGTGPHG